MSLSFMSTRGLCRNTMSNILAKHMEITIWIPSELLKKKKKKKNTWPGRKAIQLRPRSPLFQPTIEIQSAIFGIQLFMDLEGLSRSSVQLTVNNPLFSVFIWYLTEGHGYCSGLNAGPLPLCVDWELKTTVSVHRPFEGKIQWLAWAPGGAVCKAPRFGLQRRSSFAEEEDQRDRETGILVQVKMGVLLVLPLTPTHRGGLYVVPDSVLGSSKHMPTWPCLSQARPALICTWLKQTLLCCYEAGHLMCIQYVFASVSKHMCWSDRGSLSWIRSWKFHLLKTW